MATGASGLMVSAIAMAPIRIPTCTEYVNVQKVKLSQPPWPVLLMIKIVRFASDPKLSQYSIDLC